MFTEFAQMIDRHKKPIRKGWIQIKVTQKLKIENMHSVHNLFSTQNKNLDASQKTVKLKTFAFKISTSLSFSYFLNFDIPF